MHKRSDTQNLQGDLREKIIGLGERSLRKSYYPELQRRLAELEASETALADAARKWQATFDAISDPICLIDIQGKILQCNRAMASFVSQPVEEIVGNNCWEVVHGTTTPIDACPILRMRRSLRRETQVLALGDCWIEVSVDPILDDSGGLLGAVHILSDITVRKRAEVEIVRKSDQLWALAARLAEVEEAERQHLARVLHDQVCQGLTALGLTLTLLQTQMPRKTAAALRGRLADALTLVEQTGETIRNVMADLRPPMLDDYGLLSALHWFGLEFSAKTDIGVDVQGQEAVPRLAPPVELALFRIAQEAMTNVAKHARATRVVLTEEMDNGTLRLVIADNGVGFDQDRLGTPEARHLWGIMTMSKRAAAAGGRCRIESQLGQGTRVVVEVSR